MESGIGIRSDIMYPTDRTIWLAIVNSANARLPESEYDVRLNLIDGFDDDVTMVTIVARKRGIEQ